MENGIRSQKKLPLLFEKLKAAAAGVGAGRTTQVLLSVSSLVWGRINNDVRVNRVCSPDLPDYWRFRVFQTGAEPRDPLTRL